MKNFFLILFIFFVPHISAEDFHTSISKDKTSLKPYEELHITMEVDHPEEYQASIVPFIAGMNSDFFYLVSYTVQNEPTKLTLSLTMLPERLGSLILAPPILFFSSKSEKKGVLFDAFEINCEGNFEIVQTAPLLPLYPEKRITLSPEEKSKLFTSETIKKEFQQSLQDVQKRTVAWTSVVLSFLVVGFSLAFFAAIVRIRNASS